MKSTVGLQIGFGTIGSAPQTVSTPSGGGLVLFGEFGLASTQPLRGATALGDFMAEFENDADMAPRLAKARRELSETLQGDNAFRRLRLAAGLSQAKFATAAGTTQTYIARVEAGTLDPGTDMLARLAAALGVDEMTVFFAVRARRAQLGTSRVA